MKSLSARQVSTMKNNTLNLQGTGNVYRFTLAQMFRSKANIISLVILFLFSLLSLPLQSLLSGAGTVIHMPERVYLENAAGLTLDTDAIVSSLNAKKPPEIVLKDAEDEALHTSLQPGEAAVTVTVDGDELYVSGYLPSGPSFDRSALNIVIDAVREEAGKARFYAEGLPEDGLQSLANFDIEAMTEHDYRNAGPDVDQRMGAFSIQYVYAIILLMLCTISSSFIIRSVIEEKSSKLIELLMVSVSPLALLVGKILAVMTYILILFALMFLGLFISWTVTSRFLDVSSVTSLIGSIFGSQDLGAIAAKTVIVVLISLLLGFIINSLLAGLIGASCSSMNDMESANMSVVMMTLTGYLISCVVAPMANPAFDIVTSLFPVTAVFVAPVLYLIGRIALPILLLSWLIQAVFVVFLGRMAAAIYHELLLARGERISIKNLFAMMAGRRKERAA